MKLKSIASWLSCLLIFISAPLSTTIYAMAAASNGSTPLAEQAKNAETLNAAALNCCINEWIARSSEARSVIASSEKRSEWSKEVCSICQNDLVSSDQCYKYVILPCPDNAKPHCFHRECIQEWCSEKDTCPLCNHKSSDEELWRCKATKRELRSYLSTLRQLRLLARSSDQPTLAQLQAIEEILIQLRSEASPARLPQPNAAPQATLMLLAEQAIRGATQYAFSKPTVPMRLLFSLSQEIFEAFLERDSGQQLALKWGDEVIELVKGQGEAKIAPAGTFEALERLSVLYLDRPADSPRNAYLQLATQISTDLALTAPPTLARSAASRAFFLTLTAVISGTSAFVDRQKFRALLAAPSLSFALEEQFQQGVETTTSILIRLAIVVQHDDWEAAELVTTLLHNLSNDSWAQIKNSLRQPEAANSFLSCLDGITGSPNQSLKNAGWQLLQKLGSEGWVTIIGGLERDRAVTSLLSLLENCSKLPEQSVKDDVYARLESLKGLPWQKISRYLDNRTVAYNFLLCLANLAVDDNLERRQQLWLLLQGLRNSEWGKIVHNLDHPGVTTSLLRALANITTSAAPVIKDDVWRLLQTQIMPSAIRLYKNFISADTIKAFLDLLANIAIDAPNARLRELGAFLQDLDETALTVLKNNLKPDDETQQSLSRLQKAILTQEGGLAPIIAEAVRAWFRKIMSPNSPTSS